MRDFAGLLRKLRTEANLSQNALARKARVDPSYIHRIEKGERQPPSVSVIRDIAKALQLNESGTNQLLLSAGYAPVTAITSGPATHPGLQLVSDFLGDESVPPEERDLVERELELLEQRIRLVRKRRQSETADDTE
jgi:transcriptional regulator with XRE-family HTH domain